MRCEDVICGIADKDFCGLYTGQAPREGAISSMAGMWVSKEVLPFRGDVQSHGVLGRKSLF